MPFSGTEVGGAAGEDSVRADASVDPSDALGDAAPGDASSCDADLSSSRDHCGVCDKRCSQGCISGSCERTVFVTGAVYRGDFAQSKSGDARCQELATSAGLRGTYLAWLAVGDAGPAARLTHGTTKYRLVDGTLVADDWDQFASPTHFSPIDRTEYGTPVPGSVFVWTGSSPYGQPVGPNCSDWKSTGGQGTGGTSTASDMQWSSPSMTLACTQPLHLYCVEN